jgi:hypothetical protein
LDGSDSRTGSAYEALRDLAEKGEPVTVVTGLRSYEDMVITRFSVPRTPGIGKGLQFSMDLRKLTKVSSQTEEIPAGIVATATAEDTGVKKDVKQQAQSKKDLGKQATEPASSQVKQDGSVLFDLFN